jgi:hypothetical protein
MFAASAVLYVLKASGMANYEGTGDKLHKTNIRPVNKSRTPENSIETLKLLDRSFGPPNTHKYTKKK